MTIYIVIDTQGMHYDDIVCGVWTVKSDAEEHKEECQQALAIPEPSRYQVIVEYVEE